MEIITQVARNRYPIKCFAAPFIGNNTGIFQDGQVPRECGHINVEHFEQNANALFTVGKFFDDFLTETNDRGL